MKKKVNNKTNGVSLNDIYIGKVVLVKEQTDNENIDEKGRRFTNIKIRKIVFTLKGNEGTDLSKGLCKNNKYTYKVINNDAIAEDEKTTLKNNIMVIDEPKQVGSVLMFAGFPSVVNGKDIKKISKLLLSEEKRLNIQKHSVRLNGSHIFNIYQVNKANEEAIDLYKFKSSKLPIKPQEIEKVYKKYFK